MTRTFRFGISFYMVAMLFILFDIEVVFLYPVGVHPQRLQQRLRARARSSLFIFLLMVGFVYVWRRGALNWR